MTLRPTYSYSQRFVAIKDRTVRIGKAEKALAVLHDFLGQDLAQLRCLDMGCSVGFLSSRLAEDFGKVIGIDVDTAAIDAAHRSEVRPNLRFSVADVLHTPFANNSFDVIVCSQVYEHVADIELLAKEILRLLKKEGVCFFSGPNRLAFIERHYALPLLSWLPRPLAHLYLAASKQGHRYDERPLTFWQLRRALKRFVIYDYTTKIVTDPHAFYVDREGRVVRAILNWLPKGAMNRLACFSPNFNWILRKAAGDSP